MKIVVDCRYLRVGRHDGISRYTAGIVTALARLHPIEVLVSDERQLEHLPAGLPWHHVSAPTSWREPFVARQVRRTGADVVFSPMQTMGTWGRDYRVVLTLHDLIYYRHPTPPRNLPAPVRLLWRAFHLAWWPQRLLLNRADEVVTVSETTRDLIARHRLTRRPVTVVPNAPDPAPDLPRGERTRSLVYMGSFMPYKNVELPARAMAQLPGWELHLMSPVTPEQRARLEALAGEGTLVFHDGASDEVYRDVLRGATALVSGSRDEGFGLPLVEAMALGTPLVVSDIPVFREVGGAAGTYVDPDDVDGFAGAVRALDDPATWAERSAAARLRAAGYDWDISAKTLLTLLVG
ncbi:glycosyltransferase family 4 protein [Promicromonospora thailandica]|uniref:Glycosyltransferase involved in cell wall bisynthesis n=1 Tax=Promicromonospora thailandica TaxID=765201 RepID=A0A9X2G5M8_9MICO|nr:glycosyltransferase family 1 protein [Promicromonospora thailandica]MCP2266138.1 Glycosyltransferase involved in cell wall bisynthesis [Promicromonospora thailandica]